MGHANNAVYLDWLEETVGAAGGASATAGLPRRYRLDYALAAEAGTPVSAAAWRSGEAWSFRLTDGSTGADLFRATLEPAGSSTDATKEER